MTATYKDIRRVTGLSLATISKYFNGGNVLPANRVLIEQATHDLGYRVNEVARGLRSRRTMTLGVVLAQLDSTFYTTVVSGMEERLREVGYGTIICDSHGSTAAESEAIAFLVGKMVDGIVIIPVADDVPGLTQALMRGVPVVAIDRLIAGADVDAVVIDNRAAIASAVELLADAGHTAIGLLAGPETIYTMRERRLGFRQAVKRRTGHLPARSLTVADDVSVEGGYRGLHRMLALPQPPTAVVCANYDFTLGAIVALNEFGTGRVRPAVVGLDDLELARVIRPRPSLVAQPVPLIVANASRLILDRMTGAISGPGRTVVLDTELIVGDTETYALGRLP